MKRPPDWFRSRYLIGAAPLVRSHLVMGPWRKAPPANWAGSANQTQPYATLRWLTEQMAIGRHAVINFAATDQPARDNSSTSPWQAHPAHRRVVRHGAAATKQFDCTAPSCCRRAP